MRLVALLDGDEPGFYLLIFQYTRSIGADTGWGKYEFFVFLATTMLINSLVQVFFMPNGEEFSELIRTGRSRLRAAQADRHAVPDLAAEGRLVVAGQLLAVGAAARSAIALASLDELAHRSLARACCSIRVYVLCGVAILYSLMITLAATSIWLGRNQTLYDFWFYITNFSRYPMEIYQRPLGTPLRWSFTFIIPVLVVVNVPARLLAQPLRPESPDGAAAVRACGHGGQPGRLPLGVQPLAAQLPQREQLREDLAR